MSIFTSHTRPKLSKEESHKLMCKLIKKGIVKRCDLLRHGVRNITLIECWNSEKDYIRYNKCLNRDIEPVVLVKRDYSEKSSDISQNIRAFFLDMVHTCQLAIFVH